MANGDTPGGGGGSAPAPNNDFFPTPISPAPVTESNSPAPMAPPQATPQQGAPGAGPMSMQPFPLQVGPPRDEDHFNERKAGWKKVFEQFQSNPALNSGLLSFGTTLMQPAAMRGRGAQIGQLGAALQGGAETYQAARTQQMAQDAAARREVREERKVGIEEKRAGTEERLSDAKVREIGLNAQKLEQEIKDMPEALKKKYELQAAQIQEAVSRGKAAEAQAALSKVREQIASDPEMKRLDIEYKQAQISYEKAKLDATTGKIDPKLRQIQGLEGLGVEREAAINMVYAGKEFVSERVKDENAKQIAYSLIDEYRESKGRDARGNPVPWNQWVNQRTIEAEALSNGHVDAGRILRFTRDPSAPAGPPPTTAPRTSPGGPAGIPAGPQAMAPGGAPQGAPGQLPGVGKQITANTMRRTVAGSPGKSWQEVYDALQGQGYDMSQVSRQGTTSPGE